MRDHTSVIGADPADQRLQYPVSDQQAKQQRKQDRQPVFSVVFQANKKYSRHDPNKPDIAQSCDKDHDAVHKIAGVILNKMKERLVKTSDQL